jgi:PAS domain S-box-containing protein
MPSALELMHQTMIGDAVVTAMDGERRAVVVSDDGGAIIAVNRWWSELMGYSFEEVAEGLNARDISAADLPPRYREIEREGAILGTAQLRRKDGVVGSIGYRAFKSRVGGLRVVVSVTEPIDAFRVPPAESEFRGL